MEWLGFVLSTLCLGAFWFGIIDPIRRSDRKAASINRRRGFDTLDGVPAPTMTGKEFLLAQVRQETPKQLVQRLDAANVLDWEQQWAALAGHTWAQHLAEEQRREQKRAMVRHHERAMEHQRNIIAFEEARQTSILNKRRRGFSDGGVI